MESNQLVVILGATATGKTSLAVALADQLGSEIISADSRQVYRGMDLGTGKDIDEYNYNGKPIPYHIIDIVDPGYEFNVFEFQQHFLTAYNDITNRNINPILCGGTGLYIDSVLKGYRLLKVPDNLELRSKLELFSDKELVERLSSYRNLHNTTDTEDRKRIVRAIEIEEYYLSHTEESKFPKFPYVIFGIQFERQIVRDRITFRLKERLDQGMVDEVRKLIDGGVSPDALKFYGLEYKFLTQYICNEITYDEMFKRLNTAIHQFAKRQMTWFRRMEKLGMKIHWIDGNLSIDDKLSFINERI
ncbi:MAG: tRNA (adenosine(37)-N6)-dimethylallyltransferase MiaA [Hyphomicrobiales bacterium]